MGLGIFQKEEDGELAEHAIIHEANLGSNEDVAAIVRVCLFASSQLSFTFPPVKTTTMDLFFLNGRLTFLQTENQFEKNYWHKCHISTASTSEPLASDICDLLLQQLLLFR